LTYAAVEIHMSSIEVAEGQPLTFVVADEIADTDWDSVSLHGGPLFKLGQRLRLVRGTNTIRLGIAIGGSLWIMLLIVALASNNMGRAFSLGAIATHLRLLAVIPLMFICETLLDPQVSIFVRVAVASGLIPASEYPALEHDLERLNRLRNSWWPDTLAALASAPLIALGTSVFQVGFPWRAGSWDHDVLLSLAMIANVTLFRFLVFRWVWRLALWAWLLFRISRMKLHLVPSHPDRSGGLGVIEVVQYQFLPLIAAMSILLASTHAEALAKGIVPVTIIYVAACYALGVGLVIVVLPLTVFTRALKRCRERGIAEYSVLASRYVTQFQEKWIVAKTPDDLLGSADFQSLADLASGVEVVREMRGIPISLRLLIQVAIVAFLPMLPLSLFKLSVPELLQRILLRLLGG